MNSLVFNTTAAQLQASMYGLNQGSSTLQLLQLNSDGELLIAAGTPFTVNGTITISNPSLTVTGDVTVSNSITIANTSLTVTGDVTVSNPITIANASLTVAGDVTVSNPVTIANTSLTVTGDVTVSNPITIANTSLTVTGDVTVSSPITIANTSLTVTGDVTVSNPITIANTTLTVLMASNAFTSDTATIANASGTGTIFNENISTLRTATMFIDNVGSTPITVSLQLSPDGTVYFNDPNYTNIAIPAGAQTILVVDIFAQYAALQYNLGATTATFNAYYNGQA